MPSGDPFDLDDTTPNVYLHHRSARGEFRLTSDAMVQTWTRWKRTRITSVLETIPGFDESDRAQFRTLAGQMGGRILFPVRGDGTPTINVVRGQHSKIEDRFDLTLECIRRYYLRKPNPLAEVLVLYKDFFDLFENFRGYTDFFLLQDLVSEDWSAVKFFMRFDDFTPCPLPRNADEYQEYRRNTIRFVEARNHRMFEDLDQR